MLKNISIEKCKKIDIFLYDKCFIDDELIHNICIVT
jgi:hypothetical protein